MFSGTVPRCLWHRSIRKNFVLSAVHGTEDELVNYANSLKLKAELDKNEVKNELVTIQGVGYTPVKHMDEFEKILPNSYLDS